MSKSGKVKSSLRCASPEPEGISVRLKPEEPEPAADADASPPAKRRKQFAWMDSDDEASENADADEDEEEQKAPPKEENPRKRDSDEGRGTRRRDSDEERVPVPTTAAEVQSLSQMMRLMENWQRSRGKILRLPMAELSQVCQACARVKYFDAASFADIIAAVKVHLRSYCQLKADEVGGVLSGLADVNAYDKELFELAAQALNRTAGHLQRPARKVILDAFKKVKHRSENGQLKEMQEQEGKARYEEKCSEAREWSAYRGSKLAAPGRLLNHMAEFWIDGRAQVTRHWIWELRRGLRHPPRKERKAFYPSRITSIERRLAEIANMLPGELAAEVTRKMIQHQGVRLRGVRWDRYEEGGVFLSDAPKPEDPEGPEAQDATKTPATRRLLCTSGEVPCGDRSLGACAGALGGRVLAAALRLLCEDYNSSGLPDLLLWCWHGGRGIRARFVEVKSERDTLARRQRLWLWTLRGAGAEAEVCHVRDGPVQEGITRKLSSGRRTKHGDSASSDDF
ncbi:unnamed protein product [Effrenium voratum]|nr:unnamed protein product [Effrenium voratum]